MVATAGDLFELYRGYLHLLKDILLKTFGLLHLCRHFNDRGDCSKVCEKGVGMGKMVKEHTQYV